MNTDTEQGLALKSYVLGDLDPDEQLSLETRLMIDAGLFAELERVEDELVDEYLAGELTGHEKERFENFFLATRERREKLSFAKSLKRYVAEHSSKESRWSILLISWRAFWRSQNRTLKWALVAPLVLMIAVGSWSAIQMSRLYVALDQEQTKVRESHMQLRKLQSDNSQLGASLNLEQDLRSRLEQEVANLEKAPQPGFSLLPGQIQPTLLTAILSPGRSRSSGGFQEVKVPKGEALVTLDLKMEPLEYPRFQVTLQRVDGDKIRTQTESSIQGQFEGFTVSTRLLTRGDYVVRLSGITDAGQAEEIDDYYFRVVPQ